jgi:hypothetical protein
MIVVMGAKPVAPAPVERQHARGGLKQITPRRRIGRMTAISSEDSTGDPGCAPLGSGRGNSHWM